jgi:hypothetical protein
MNRSIRKNINDTTDVIFGILAFAIVYISPWVVILVILGSIF